MEDACVPIHLPPDYDENVLHLLVQSPSVLYVYWELSPGLKSVLNEKSRVKIRLNIEGQGAHLDCDVNLKEKSYYFNEVEPGLTYNCEIGIVNSENAFYPLLRSNSVITPHDRPASNTGLGNEDAGLLPSSTGLSSFVFFKDK